MKKLMKKAMALMLALLMVAGLAACGAPAGEESKAPENTQSTESKTPENTPAGSTDEEVTLKWAVWDINLTTYYQPLIDAYVADHPNVKIEMVDLGSSDYQNALITQLTGNADLDVVCVKDIPGYANLVKGGYLADLSGEGIDSAPYGGTIEQITVDGKFYALPFRSDHWVIYYNKDLFDKAGVEYPTNDMTVAEYDELARKMTSGTGAEKVYGSHFHTWRSAPSLFAVLDGKNTVVDGSYDFMKSTYEWVLAEQNDGICQDYGTLKATNTHYSGVFFNNQVAMMNMGSWFIPTQIEKVKSGESLSPNWGIVKYPHPEGVAAGSTLGQVTSLGINPNSAKKEAAADFLNWVATEDAAKALAATGNFPAISTAETSELLASTEGFPTDDASKEALTIAALYLEMPMSDKASDIEQVLNTEHDAIMTGAETVDEGIANMNEQVQAILNG